MRRIALTDGTGRWFDVEKAERFCEDTWWDGRNQVSRATGSSRAHQELFRTAGGRWILCSWTDYDGDETIFEEVSAGEAARWLSINDYEPHGACAAEHATLEIA